MGRRALTRAVIKGKFMRRFEWLCVVGIFLLVITGACRSRQPETDYRPTATIKDVVDSTVEPSADFLWDAVATDVTAKGVKERAPHTTKNGRRCARTRSVSSKRRTCC